MNYGLKNHFNIIKYKQLKQPNNTNEKEKYRQLSLFRNSIFTSKPKQSNYKTSKNSPERFYIEKPKNSNIKKNPFSSFNKINLITHINLNNKINEKNFDNLLKTKIIKIKEKKAITTGNSLINSSINLTNNTFNHNNTSSCLNNYIPHSNYNNIKTKNKIIHDLNSKNKKKKSQKKKINYKKNKKKKKKKKIKKKKNI